MLELLDDAANLIRQELEAHIGNRRHQLYSRRLIDFILAKRSVNELSGVLRCESCDNSSGARVATR